jgi:hypothetical protein
MMNAKQKRAPAKSALQKLTSGPILRADAGESNRTLLSWWRACPGVCRFQTTSAGFARKLSQRSGARLVAWSVGGGYLRVFQERIQPWRARSLVRRYLAQTNGRFCDAARPPARRKQAGDTR